MDVFKQVLRLFYIYNYISVLSVFAFSNIIFNNLSLGLYIYIVLALKNIIILVTQEYRMKFEKFALFFILTSQSKDPVLLTDFLLGIEIDWVTEYACPVKSINSNSCQLTMAEHNIDIDLTPLKRAECMIFIRCLKSKIFRDMKEN